MMISTVTDNELRALCSSLDAVDAVEFRTDVSGLSIRPAGDGEWTPVGVVTERDETSRFVHIGPAKVHAFFYDKAEDYFVVLSENPGAVHPWVVASMHDMGASEWNSGRHMRYYGDAVAAYVSRVVESTSA